MSPVIRQVAARNAALAEQEAAAARRLEFERQQEHQRLYGRGGGGGGSGSGSGDGGSGGLASTASRIMAMTTLMRTTRAGREKTARFLESQAVSHFQQATWLDAQMWDAHWQLGRLLVSE